MKNPSHKWAFRPCFRANAFGWRASKLASQRLEEATSEIRAVARKESVTAADGAILLMEKLGPALAHVDSSRYPDRRQAFWPLDSQGTRIASALRARIVLPSH